MDRELETKQYAWNINKWTFDYKYSPLSLLLQEQIFITFHNGTRMNLKKYDLTIQPPI